MTAAVVPSALLPPVAPPDHPSADRHSGDQHTARPAGRRTRNTPYLVPVPDCEPPFDDEVGHPRRTSLQLSTGAAVDPNPDDANRGHGPDAATTDLATETFGRARPNSAPEPSIGSPASTDPAPSDPGQEDPDNRSVWRRDRPPIPSRPLRTPDRSHRLGFARRRSPMCCCWNQHRGAGRPRSFPRACRPGRRRPTSGCVRPRANTSRRSIGPLRCWPERSSRCSPGSARWPSFACIAPRRSMPVSPNVHPRHRWPYRIC